MYIFICTNMAKIGNIQTKICVKKKYRPLRFSILCITLLWRIKGHKRINYLSKYVEESLDKTYS